MTKRTQPDWQALIARHKQSGLTQNAFCAEQGVKPKSFSCEKRKAETAPRKPKPAFVKATPEQTTSASAVRLIHGNTVIELQSASPSYLLQLVRGLA